MSDRVEKTAAVVALCLTVPGLVIAIIFGLRLWSSNRPLRMENAKDLPTHIPPQGVSDLLIAPSGQLVATFQGATYVDVFRWDLHYQATKESVNFAAFIGSATPELVPPFAAASGSAVPKRPAVPTNGLPYALSNEGTSIAWSWRGRLFVGPLKNPGRYQRQLDPATPVVALSFFQENLVGVLHEDGSFRLEKFPQPAPNLAGTELKGFWRISGRGSFRILSRFDTKEGFLVNPASRRVYEGFPTSPTGTFITVSPMGKVAMGTAEGTVLFPQFFGRSPSVALPERKAVRLLAFHDEDNLVAGVQGGHLFLVEDAARAAPLGVAPTNIRLLAVRGSRMAMVTANAISVATLKRRIELDDHEKWLLALTFSLLSFLAFLRLIATDSTKLILLIRDGRRAAQPAPPVQDAPCPESPSPATEDGETGPQP